MRTGAAHANRELKEQSDGSEARSITMSMRTGEMQFDGLSYLLHVVMPNPFFHGATACAILREAGVPIGKTDCMGAPR